MTSTEHKFLSIEEKRAWLARIFRDASGYYSDADKFKALREDTLLASLYMQGDQPKPTSVPSCTNCRYYSIMCQHYERAPRPCVDYTPNLTHENTETHPLAVDNCPLRK